MTRNGDPPSPAISIDATAAALSNRRDIGVGVQNIWTEPAGAFTGETSGPMAHRAGATFALVGHSERRHVFGETNAQTTQKCVAAVAAGLLPILCVGETLEQREAGHTAEVVLAQLLAGIAGLAIESVLQLLVAYEPVWAIGTGKTASPADASQVHAAIRAALAEQAGGNASGVPILYGGSVSIANARSLLDAAGVDGLLVGGASLNPESWASICAT